MKSKDIQRPNKGRNLAASPNYVPAVIVQGRLYPEEEIGRRPIPTARHDLAYLQRRYGN